MTPPRGVAVADEGNFMIDSSCFSPRNRIVHLEDSRSSTFRTVGEFYELAGGGQIIFT